MFDDLALKRAERALMAARPGMGLVAAQDIVTTVAAALGGPSVPATAQNRIAEELLAERMRQIRREGWTADHDDEHRDGGLAMAAACYAAIAAATVGHAAASAARPTVADDVLAFVQRCWPWAVEWWKPKHPRRDLMRAGALIVAEIERLDRLAPPEAAA
jgi:hypothetical protein